MPVNFSVVGLLSGKRTDVSALVLLRGETLMEHVEEGAMLVLMLVRGSATVSRSRAEGLAGIHLTPRCMEPVWLTSPGTYTLVARDYTVGVRVVRRRGDA